MKKFTNTLALFSAALAGLLLVKNRAPRGFILWIPKVISGALAPFNAMAGIAIALLGFLTGSPLAVLLGGFAGLVSGRYVREVTAQHDGFERAFGPGWQYAVSPDLEKRMLPRRWSWGMPETGIELPLSAHIPGPDAAVRWQRDLSIGTIPGTGRELLADLWQPPVSVPQTGLGFIFLHGGAWTMMDKDTGTRSIFRHLASQGHVILDVAYRLFPETDMVGMVGDADRAIAWMKDNAVRLGINPERVVIGGTSAGGHLALLAAYAAGEPRLTPAGLMDRDLSVRAVVSFYGPPDLEACYYHTSQGLEEEESSQEVALMVGEDVSRLLRRVMGGNYQRLGFDKGTRANLMVSLLGAPPEEDPEKYRQLSPLTYVQPGSPPTLLIQGEDDLLTPAWAGSQLYDKLVMNGVPVVSVILPHTDHGFDLILPEINPAAQTAMYDLERFLAVMAK